MTFFTQILTNTPIWVWALLAMLSFIGISATRTRTVAAMQLMVPAIVFGVIALGKLALLGFDAFALLGTATGGAVALVAVALMQPAKKTVRNSDGRYTIRGEWTTLVVILLVFIGNYAGNVAAALAPETARASGFIVATTAINGFSTLFFATRAIAHLHAGARPAGSDIRENAGA